MVNAKTKHITYSIPYLIRYVKGDLSENEQRKVSNAIADNEVLRRIVTGIQKDIDSNSNNIPLLQFLSESKSKFKQEFIAQTRVKNQKKERKFPFGFYFINSFDSFLKWPFDQPIAPFILALILFIITYISISIKNNHSPSIAHPENSVLLTEVGEENSSMQNDEIVIAIDSQNLGNISSDTSIRELKKIDDRHMEEELKRKELVEINVPIDSFNHLTVIEKKDPGGIWLNPIEQVDSSAIKGQFDIPSADFTLDSYGICRGETIVFSNESKGSIYRYLWDFGDGNYSTEKNPEYTYQEPGEYEISLIVSGENNFTDTSSVRINVNSDILAFFSTSAQEGCAPLTVEFINFSNPRQIEWNFGDGTTSNAKNPIHIFETPGTYIVELLASNQCGFDSTSQEITVFPSPLANFNISEEVGCAPLEIELISPAAGGYWEETNWDFGDGFFSTDKNPTHEFLNPGNYTITYIVSNDCGTSSSSKEIKVLPKPIAAFDLLESEGCSPFEPGFINNSVGANSYKWSFGENLVSNDEYPKLQFSEAGSYDILLIATHSYGCSDSVLLNNAITVYESPIAKFSIEVNEDPLGGVQFLNRSLNSDRFLWDFGDGNFSKEKSPYHVYDSNEPISVKLTAYNDNEKTYLCTNTNSVRLNVNPEWITSFFAPNAFAPEYGEPGIDIFKPVGLGIKEYEISVYSPWGKLVWRSTELENGSPSEFWNGKLFNTGEVLPQGAYSWIAKVTFNSGKEIVEKGTVTILR